MEYDNSRTVTSTSLGEGERRMGLVDDEKEEEEEEEGAGQCGVEELSIFLQGFLRLRLCSFSLNSSTPRHSGDMSLSKTLMQLVSGVLLGASISSTSQSGDGVWCCKVHTSAEIKPPTNLNSG